MGRGFLSLKRERIFCANVSKKLVTIELLFRLMGTPKTGSDKCPGKLLSTCTSSLEKSLPPVNYPVFLRFFFFFLTELRRGNRLSIDENRKIELFSTKEKKKEERGERKEEKGKNEWHRTVINLHPLK